MAVSPTGATSSQTSPSLDDGMLTNDTSESVSEPIPSMEDDEGKDSASVGDRPDVVVLPTIAEADVTSPFDLSVAAACTDWGIITRDAAMDLSDSSVK